MTRFCAFASLLTVAVAAGGCASTGAAPDQAQLSDAIRARTGAAIRTEPDAPLLPVGVLLDDGISETDAVATALWNSPTFRLALADLGIARADVVEAGLLRNPIFSLLFPWGPKQLEWTIQFPLELLWQRPRRVAAAELNAQAVGQRLIYDGVVFVGDVRRAYAETVATAQRADLAADNAMVVERLRQITDARLRAGDISELESRAARNDAAQAAALVQTLAHDRDASRIALFALMGIDIPPAAAPILHPAGGTITPCATEPAGLLETALASRPDVRAAEIAIEAAGQRAKWERTRVVTLIAVLDANGQGRDGYELGPGIGAEMPIFSRNQGAIGRAEVEIERAGYAYAAVRLRVSTEVRTALVRFTQAQRANDVWTRDIVPSLEMEQQQAEGAYRAGELALISLLDVNRRLGEARLRAVDASASLMRAAIALDQSVGRVCDRDKD
jgi:outer membrane protein, heavy metal efflux system